MVRKKSVTFLYQSVWHDDKIVAQKWDNIIHDPPVTRA